MTLVLSRMKVDLPKVVVMDTGVNMIPTLRSFVIKQESYHFSNPGDEYSKDGHGTPIANLVVYGENGAQPAARIISYKIFSEDSPSVAFHGMVEGIKKFSKETRLFISSIGIPNLPDLEAAYLDQLVQNRNICLVCSAGNIPKDMIISYLKGGANYPKYLKFNPVIPPSIGSAI